MRDALTIISDPVRLHELLDFGLLPSSIRNAATTRQFPIEFQPFPSRKMVALLEEVRACSFAGAARAMFMKGKILEILALALDNHVEEPGDGWANRLVYDARALLLADPARPPTMKALALQLGVPGRRLGEAFRIVLGVTPTEWLAQWRLAMSADMLAEGLVSIKEIAALAGYSHVNNFTNAFTRRYGVSPHRYRREKS